MRKPSTPTVIAVVALAAAIATAALITAGAIEPSVYPIPR